MWMPILVTSSNTALDTSTSTVKQRKEIKATMMKNDEIKRSLRLNNMIVHIGALRSSIYNIITNNRNQ